MKDFVKFDMARPRNFTNWSSNLLW